MKAETPGGMGQIEPTIEPTEPTIEPTERELVAIEEETAASHRAREMAHAAFGWQDRAACRGTSGDHFFPDRGASTKYPKAVCRGGIYRGEKFPECPVREECFRWAMDLPERFGIWGGFSERERRRMRREMEKEEEGDT